MALPPRAGAQTVAVSRVRSVGGLPQWGASVTFCLRVAEICGPRMLQVEQLIERVKAYQPSVDSALIQRAYDYSFRAHAGQRRKSGQPYIVHPVGVASVCAGLLHDVVEDTLATTEEIQKEFGVEVAELVDGVTKLSKINFTSKEDRQAENFR